MVGSTADGRQLTRYLPTTVRQLINMVTTTPKTEFGSTDPTRMYADGTYLDNNQTWHVEDSPWKAGNIRKMMERNRINPKTVCEVGCGAGEILKQLSAALPLTHFVGYELSPQAIALCKTRQSASTEYLQKNILNESVFFDCLLCIDVFEHVEDYIGFIKALKTKATYSIFHIPLDVSVLSIARCSLITTRAGVGHLHYFTRETALATLRDCGYEVVDSFYTVAFDDLPGKTLKSRVGRIPRKLLFSLSPHLAVRLLGGCSLMVLTKNAG